MYYNLTLPSTTNYNNEIDSVCIDRYVIIF